MKQEVAQGPFCVQFCARSLVQGSLWSFGDEWLIRFCAEFGRQREFYKSFATFFSSPNALPLCERPHAESPRQKLFTTSHLAPHFHTSDTTPTFYKILISIISYIYRAKKRELTKKLKIYGMVIFKVGYKMGFFLDPRCWDLWIFM